MRIYARFWGAEFWNSSVFKTFLEFQFFSPPIRHREIFLSSRFAGCCMAFSCQFQSLNASTPITATQLPSGTASETLGESKPVISPQLEKHEEGGSHPHNHPHTQERSRDFLHVWTVESTPPRKRKSCQEWHQFKKFHSNKVSVHSPSQIERRVVWILHYFLWGQPLNDQCQNAVMGSIKEAGRAERYEKNKVCPYHEYLPHDSPRARICKGVFFFHAVKGAAEQEKAKSGLTQKKRKLEIDTGSSEPHGGRVGDNKLTEDFHE
ncbi:hypothetical protein BU15DRAFT_63410 [Melanogaster broomeanus]|nr:hypothetical protein BU15DRAFT_63410 [Melanogaster broomeanus]